MEAIPIRLVLDDPAQPYVAENDYNSGDFIIKNISFFFNYPQIIKELEGDTATIRATCIHADPNLAGVPLSPAEMNTVHHRNLCNFMRSFGCRVWRTKVLLAKSQVVDKRSSKCNAQLVVDKLIATKFIAKGEPIYLATPHYQCLCAICGAAAEHEGAMELKRDANAAQQLLDQHQSLSNTQNTGATQSQLIGGRAGNASSSQATISPRVRQTGTGRATLVDGHKVRPSLSKNESSDSSHLSTILEVSSHTESRAPILDPSSSSKNEVRDVLGIDHTGSASKEIGKKDNSTQGQTEGGGNPLQINDSNGGYQNSPPDSLGPSASQRGHSPQDSPLEPPISPPRNVKSNHFCHICIVLKWLACGTDNTPGMDRNTLQINQDGQQQESSGQQQQRDSGEYQVPEQQDARRLQRLLTLVKIPIRPEKSHNVSGRVRRSTGQQAADQHQVPDRGANVHQSNTCKSMVKNGARHVRDGLCHLGKVLLCCGVSAHGVGIEDAQ
nr:uncharacterized protein CTRU02_06675 [Colletotrichum truncatum]KAF6792592.1 hypothetical protein CTRU02_06675 [Colletotrichum truncatum]